MARNIQLVIITFLASTLLVACEDNASTVASEKSTTAASTKAKMSSSDSIKTGQSWQAVTDLLGKANFTQTRVIDDLTVIHAEWVNDNGVISIQFHNGNVAFHQFIPQATRN